MSDDPTQHKPDSTDTVTETAQVPAPRPAKPVKEAPKDKNPYTWGTGRRKASVARVRIRPGDGKFIINKRTVEEYFKLEKDRKAVRTPLVVTETGETTDVFVNVGGGGITGQAGAVLLGVARALVKTNPDYMPKLKEHNLLTRDPRRVERKKPGQPGARKRFQFSKR